MRRFVCLVSFCAIAGCATPDESALDAPVNTLPSGRCPNGEEATWCLSFSDGSAASITIVNPEWGGYLMMGRHELKLQGEVDVSTGRFTLAMSTLDIDGAITRGETEGKAWFIAAAVSEPARVFAPSVVPKELPVADDTVSGQWVGFFPAAPSQAVEIQQLGELLILFWTQLRHSGSDIPEIWLGKRNGLSFSFPNQTPYASGGSWLNGTFSTDLTAATGTRCDAGFVGEICTPITMVRK